VIGTKSHSWIHGGALDVGGSCSVKGCHDNHHYSLSVDEHNVNVKSAGSYLCLLFFMCENIVKLIEIVISKGASVLFSLIFPVVCSAVYSWSIIVDCWSCPGLTS